MATLCTPPLALSAPLRGTRELTVRKLELVQSKGAPPSAIWLFLRTAAT